MKAKRIISLALSTVTAFTAFTMCPSAINTTPNTAYAASYVDKDNPIKATTAPKVAVLINGKRVQFDTRLMFIDDNLMVPMRAIFEELGYTVAWDQTYGIVYASNYDTNTGITTRVGDACMTVLDLLEIRKYEYSTDEEKQKFYNDNTMPLEVAPVLYNDRVYVPVRAISEASGAKVTWDGDNRLVLISTGGYSYEENPVGEIVDNVSGEYKKLTNYMDSGLYLEAMTLCDELLEKRISTLEEIYVLSTRDEAERKYNEYINRNEDISSEINQINDYINKGLYLEAMNLCDSTLTKKISEDDKNKLSSLRSTAETKYNSYLSNKAKAPISQELKNKLYKNAQNYIRRIAKSPSNIIWTDDVNDIFFIRGTDGTITFLMYAELMNGFGGYKKEIFMFEGYDSGVVKSIL